MKQIRIIVTFTLVVFFTAINCVALSTDSISAITMESYEQRWLDSNGTIALKNNTSEYIHSVSFQLEYLDMQDKPMDYVNFSYSVSIAPGKTKKIDIPAYEHKRFYHYYKTKEANGNPKFKLRFELLNYNSQITEPKSWEQRLDNYNDKDSSTVIYPVIIGLFALCIVIGLYYLVAVMARNRKRDPAVWVVLSFVISPLLVCLVLLIAGSKHKN